MANAWLNTEHPIYRERKIEWQINERRFRAGMDVLQELRRFDWEAGVDIRGQSTRSQELAAQTAVEKEIAAGGRFNRTHFASRQGEATYINFPEAFATILVGHMMSKAPERDLSLDFGTLGKVQRAKGVRDPSRAELIYFNADGVGTDGSQWNNFWTEVAKWAMATGHRWNMVEATRQRPQSLADEIAGRRPYLVHYSPLRVTNWQYEAGTLLFAILKFPYRNPRVVGEEMVGNDWQEGRRLLTAAGFKDFGDQYAAGGWWDFDKDGEPMPGRTGTWESTRGKIPMWATIYQRDTDRFSRSGTFEIGQAAVAYMNIDSAASFDAWDAAQSVEFLLGVTQEAHNLAMSLLEQGTRYPPLPSDAEAKTRPDVADGSIGAVAAEVFDKRLARILEAIRRISVMESSSAPDSSGLSKEMGFLEGKSPRLRLFASELEASQNIAISFLEQRNGATQPTGSVQWARDFDLAPILEQLDAFLKLQVEAGITSPTLTKRALMRAADEASLLSQDDDRSKIEKEYDDAIANSIADAAQRRSILGEGFLPGTGGGGGGGGNGAPAPAGAGGAA
jgi:hypothetical protein